MTLLDVAALLLGVAAAWAYVVHAKRSGTRSFQVLAAGLIIAALIYVVAALVQGAMLVVLLEVLGAVAFSAAAMLGLRRATGWLALGWALHVVWDLAGQLAEEPVLPLWYAIACLGFDLVVAGFIVRSSSDRSAGSAA